MAHTKRDIQKKVISEQIEVAVLRQVAAVPTPKLVEIAGNVI